MSRFFVTSCGILLGYDFDFEEFAPSFACHEDTFRGRVVGDAVQYVGIRGDLFVREQAAQVDDPFDDAAGGVDDDDLVGDIDIGPDLPVDPLQFVEQLYRGTPEGDRHAALHPKGFRIEDAQIFAAVAHVEPLAVGREAPSFARIGESAELPARCRVIDVGFDVTSPNFYDTTLTATRIRRFWDQLSPDSIGSGMYVGADYRTPEDILAYAHSHDGLIETHGTHTLGIAAGTGFDTPYRGMAYDADICIVSNAVNTDLPLIPEELLYKYTSATDVLGFKYIFDYAQEVGKPCVISFSEGSSQSFDDDERLFEEVLGQIQGPGRILVASAGNDGARRTYQHKPRGVERDGVFFLSQSDRTFFCMASENQFQICLSAYTSATDREQLYIPTADILNAEDSTVVDSVDFFGHRLKYTIQACRAYFNPDLIAYYLLAEMQGGVGWSLFLSAEAVGEDAAVDFYSSATQFYPSEINPSISGGEPAYSVGSPGCAPSVICVGATAYRDHIVNADGVAQTYDCGHDGEVADYSSVGPTRDGRIKPDVVANGTHVVSSASSYFIEANPEGSVKDYTVATSRFHDRTYPWAAFLGTSMSTPVVAGTIALWLQANPDLTTRQVMDVLAATSHRRDGARQGEKDNRWGYGEIDAYAGLLRVLGLDGISEISNHHPSRLDIKYADDTVWLSAEGEVPAERVSVAIYSVAGKRMLQKAVRLSSDSSGISLSSLPSGVYVVQTTSVTPGFTGSCVFRK